MYKLITNHMKTVLNLSLHLYSAPFYCEIKDFFVTKLFVWFPYIQKILITY